MNNTLFVIPARGGSKGIPDKNIKLLGGKPLIQWSIDIAKQLASEENICVSTDSEKIKETVESIGLKVPFLRPAELATDQSGTYEVLLHTISYYEGLGRNFERMVLLQPTSPFRKVQHIREAVKIYSSDLDMVVSVRESHDNPYFNLFEENSNGFLIKSKEGSFVRRQDCPPAFAYNGAIYVINIESLKQQPIYKFRKIRKYVMDEISSVDLDTPLDWAWAEFLLKEKMV